MDSWTQSFRALGDTILETLIFYRNRDNWSPFTLSILSYANVALFCAIPIIYGILFLLIFRGAMQDMCFQNRGKGKVQTLCYLAHLDEEDRSKAVEQMIALMPPRLRSQVNEKIEKMRRTPKLKNMEKETGFFGEKCTWTDSYPLGHDHDRELMEEGYSLVGKVCKLKWREVYSLGDRVADNIDVLKEGSGLAEKVTWQAGLRRPVFFRIPERMADFAVNFIDDEVFHVPLDPPHAAYQYSTNKPDWMQSLESKLECRCKGERRSTLC